MFWFMRCVMRRSRWLYERSESAVTSSETLSPPASLEERLAATVERTHGDQLQLIEEVRQNLAEIRERVDALRTRA